MTTESVAQTLQADYKVIACYQERTSCPLMRWPCSRNTSTDTSSSTSPAACSYLQWGPSGLSYAGALQQGVRFLPAQPAKEPLVHASRRVLCTAKGGLPKRVTSHTILYRPGWGVLASAICMTLRTCTSQHPCSVPRCVMCLPGWVVSCSLDLILQVYRATQRRCASKCSVKQQILVSCPQCSCLPQSRYQAARPQLKCL